MLASSEAEEHTPAIRLPEGRAPAIMLPGDLAVLAHGTPHRRTLWDWVIDTLLFAAALFVWVDVRETFSPGDFRGLPEWMLAGDLWLGAVACLALWWRRRFPVTLAVVLSAAPVVSTSATGAAVIAVFTVAVHREWPIPALVTALHVLVAVPFGLLFPPSGSSGGENAVWLLMMYAAALGWGRAVRVRRRLVVGLQREAEQQRREHALRLADARRAERTRIAREMHDVLAHRISLLSVHAGALAYRSSQAAAGAGPALETDEVRDAAEVIHSNAHLALDELATVLMVLRTDDGPVAHQLPQIADLVTEAQAAGQQITYETTTGVQDLPRAQVQRTAYRTVQEGLTNARKHAPDAPVAVRIGGHPGGRLEITVTNPLPRQCPEHGIPGSGTGLAGLAERVALDGGTLEHGPVDGVFRLAARLPWAP